MKRKLIKLTVGLFVLLLLITMMTGPGLLSLVFTLLLGWCPSFLRMYQTWHPNPASACLFATATLALVVGSHFFLRWAYRCTRNNQEASSTSAWSWKWTLCGFGALFCTLLAIGSVVLTTHQLYWFSQSSDPLFTDPFRSSVWALRVAGTLKNKAEEAQWDSTETRAAFGEMKSSIGQPPLEILQPVWIAQDEQRLRAIVLVPRRPLNRARARLTILQPGSNMSSRSLDELPQVLASFGLGGGARSSGEKQKPALLP